MKQLGRLALALAALAAAGLGAGCHRADPAGELAWELSPAPPAPPESGPVPDLAEPPPDAVVFDLRYRVQTGAQEDVEYRSYWGYGGSESAAAQAPFIRAVRQQAKRIHYVPHFGLGGRPWSALEYERQRPLAFYFDLNADGQLAENERIPPTRTTESGGIEFITPDFVLEGEDGRECLFRVLLQARFYGGNSRPNCMWSPACVLEGTAMVEGKPARLILFSSGFDGVFDRFGSSTYALLVGDTNIDQGRYLPRQRLSSLVRCDGQFYRVRYEGQRSEGHVARAVFVRDTSTTGTLVVKFSGTNGLETVVRWVNLQGDDDQTVFFGIDDLNRPLPVGRYRLERGDLAYGVGAEPSWQVSFAQGPVAALEAGKSIEAVLGAPTLTVRAIDQRERYSSSARESSVFPQGTELYLEPRITGKAGETLTRFGRNRAGGGQTQDVPPRITITGPDGKELLSRTMEYG